MTDSEPRLGSRALFPELAYRAYVNHASVSPASVAVGEATRALVADYGRRGFGAFAHYHAHRAVVREKLARFLGASPESIAFTPGTTRGISDLALCIPWKAGDRVILFEGEFPTNVTPFQRAAELFGLQVVMLATEEFRLDEPRALERLARELERGARLVAVSAVEFQTGHLMPLAEMGELCHRSGAELFVDAMQAVGIVPLDLGALPIDYLVGGCHKWLMALDGLGYLYARPESAAKLRPSVAGWMSHEDPVSFLRLGLPGNLRYDRPIRKTIDFLEGGSLSAFGVVALEASLDLLARLGPAAILSHAQRYHDALEPGLETLGFVSLRSRNESRRSGILSLRGPADLDLLALQRHLEADGIACSVPDGNLRFSPHWPNALEEVDAIVESVTKGRLAARKAER